MHRLLKPVAVVKPLQIDGCGPVVGQSDESEAARERRPAGACIVTGRHPEQRPERINACRGHSLERQQQARGPRITQPARSGRAGGPSRGGALFRGCSGERGSAGTRGCSDSFGCFGGAYGLA
jgi:hypothetical protein